MEDNTWAFLKSNRFYAGILTAIGIWLQTPDPFTAKGVGVLIAAIGGIFVGIRTADRFSETLNRQPKVVTETTKVSPATTVETKQQADAPKVES